MEQKRYHIVFGLEVMRACADNPRLRGVVEDAAGFLAGQPDAPSGEQCVRAGEHRVTVRVLDTRSPLGAPEERIAIVTGVSPLPYTIRFTRRAWRGLTVAHALPEQYEALLLGIERLREVVWGEHPRLTLIRGGWRVYHRARGDTIWILGASHRAPVPIRRAGRRLRAAEPGRLMVFRRPSSCFRTIRAAVLSRVWALPHPRGGRPPE